jgi:hypothetical protein
MRPIVYIKIQNFLWFTACYQWFVTELKFSDEPFVYYSIVLNMPNFPRNLRAQAAGLRDSGSEPEAAFPVSGLVSS